MSYRDHSQSYKPARAIPTRRTPWWMRLLAVMLAAVLMLALGLGASLIILRLEARDAQLERVHLQGMAVGMTMCAGAER